MTFPTDTENVSTNAAVELVNMARNLRITAVDLIAECDTGTIDVKNIYERFMGRQLAPSKVRTAILQAVPGIYDALAENWPSRFVDATAAQTQANEMASAIDTLITLLETEAPVDGSNYLLVLIAAKNGSGSVTNRAISNAGAIATLRAALVTFRDTFTT